METPWKSAAGQGSVDPRTGYRTITVDGARWLEHRYVMDQYLRTTEHGPIRPDETVHHKVSARIGNGPLDNTLANLELWPGDHCMGNRVTDQARWVRTWLDLYGSLPDVAAATVAEP
jgi:hypothetical protein